MSRAIRAREQLSLLDWTPPEAVAAYDPRLIIGNSFSGRLARAISVTLESCGRSRDEVAGRMSAHFGRTISVNVLNAYASPMRESHDISVPRFDGLLAATGDRRLLEFIAEPHGLAVIDRRFLPMIELAAMTEHRRELEGRERALRRQVRGGRR